MKKYALSQEQVERLAPILGGAAGAAMGGTAGYLGSKTKKERTPRALLGAAGGGLVGALAGKALYDAALDEGIQSFATGEPSSWRNILLGASIGGLGGAAAGYAGTSDQNKKIRRALAGMAAGGAIGGSLGAATGYWAGQSRSKGRLAAGRQLNNLIRGLKFSSFVNRMEKEAQWAWVGRLAGRLGGSLARRSGTLLPRLGAALQRQGANLVLSSPLARRLPIAVSAEATSVFRPQMLRATAPLKMTGLPARGTVLKPTSPTFAPPGSFAKQVKPLPGEAMSPLDATISRSRGMEAMIRRDLHRVGMPLHEIDAAVPAMMRGEAAAMSRARPYYERFARGQRTVLPEVNTATISSPALKVTPTSPIPQPSLTPGPVVSPPSYVGGPVATTPIAQPSTVLSPRMPSSPSLPGLDQTLPPKLIPAPVPMPAFAPA